MGFVGGFGVTNIDMIYSGIDHLPAVGEEVFSRGFGIYLGGGIPASLVNLGRLGMETRIFTFLGSDMFSDFARREYQGVGAEVFNLYDGPEIPVVLSSTMLCGGDRSFMSYVFRPEMTGDMQERIYAALRGADVVLMHPGFPEMYRALKDDGAKLIFDTGWEEDLSTDKYAVYLELADYYLPNRKEALKITGCPTVEAAAEALERWVPRPVVKLDGEGCLYRESGATHIVPPMPDITAVDATGAGDAFMAGFAYGVAHGCSMERCVQFGNITGGACVQAYGCLTNYVDEAQLLAARASVYG